MAGRRVLEDIEGDVRFHHLTPELWVLDARDCAHRWVVFHETYSFGLITRGPMVDWRYTHRTYSSDPDHAMLMQPGELHANLKRTPPGDFIVVQVTESLLKRTAHALGWRHADVNIKHPHPASDHPALLDALRRFRAALCSDLFDPDAAGGVCTCARAAALHVDNLNHLVAVFLENCAERAREIVQPGRGAAAIRKAVRFLQRHYKDPYDLHRIAAAAGCAPHYLVHLFTDEFGIPPSTYKNRILVAKMCEALVAAPTKPLQAIAEEVGWPGRARDDNPDRSNLMIRHFRRTFGTTPDEFRAGFRRLGRHAPRP
jgi:AraC-like DNA-binding protein